MIYKPRKKTWALWAGIPSKAQPQPCLWEAANTRSQDRKHQSATKQDCWSARFTPYLFLTLTIVFSMDDTRSFVVAECDCLWCSLQILWWLRGTYFSTYHWVQLTFQSLHAVLFSEIRTNTFLKQLRISPPASSHMNTKIAPKLC